MYLIELMAITQPQFSSYVRWKYQLQQVHVFSSFFVDSMTRLLDGIFELVHPTFQAVLNSPKVTELISRIIKCIHLLKRD